VIYWFAIGGASTARRCALCGTPSIPKIRQLYDIENIHDITQQPLGQYKKYRQCCLAKKLYKSSLR